MELVSRMLDGSIPYDLKGALRGLRSSSFRVGQDAKIERLQEVPLLEGCSGRQLRAVARITRVLEAQAGTMLTRVGEPGDEFFLILDGTARVEVSPKKQPRLGPGAFFGEMSLLDGGPRSATVIAETDVRLLVIHRRDFWRLLDQVPELNRQILMTLSRRIRQAEQLSKA